MSKVITIFKLIKRILTHKFWVAYYCFQIGLYWQGLTHDMSKFSWSEFAPALRYWDDKISSLANERKILGYSRTFLHHRGRNPHHYEYWIHSLDEGGIPCEMPKKYALELVCDYLAAARTYGSNPRDEFDWWIKNCDKLKIHPKTKKFIYNTLFSFKSDSSLRSAVLNLKENKTI